MGPLVLASNFLMAAGPSQGFIGDWRPIDSEYQFATIHVHCQTITPFPPITGYEVMVDSSFDTVESNQIGTTIVVSTTGSLSSPVTTNLGPLVRLRIENPDAVAMLAIMSVWLQPKRRTLP